MDVQVRYRTGDRPRRILSFVLLAAAAIVLASCASDTTHAGQPVAAHHTTPTTAMPATPPATTTVRTFSPYATTGTLATKVTGRTRGSCFTSSAAAPVAGAYRCFAGNALLDPCFALHRSSRTVACLESPWVGAIVMTLTKPLPKATPFGDGSRAWALQLDDGTRCVASTGTVPAVAGVNLAYRCSGGGAAAVVDPHAELVVARYAAPGAKTLQQHAVRMLWRG